MNKAPRLTPAVLYDNREALLKVYPELKPLCDKLNAKIEAEGCKGCARNKYLRELMKDLLEIKHDGRDLTPLESFLQPSALTPLTGAGRGVANPAVAALEPEQVDCPHCAQKHLCATAVLLNETLNGYPEHLAYAQAHYEEAVREGYAGPRLTITRETADEIITKIWKYLELDKDEGRMIGLLTALGELTSNKRNKHMIRMLRTRLQPISPPQSDTAPVDSKKEAAWPDKLILHTHLSPGDIVMVTALARDIHAATGGKTKIAMDTTCREFWKHNPRVDQELLKDKQARKVKLNYTAAIGRCNQLPYHFIHGYRQTLEEQLGRSIPCTGATGEIFISAAEKKWDGLMEKHLGDAKPYWLIMAGGKSDFTTKLWPREHWLEVIEAMRDRITIVQVGRRTKGTANLKHYQPRLPGVVDLVNKTNLRELCRLVYHSAGTTCGITSLMHLSAAIKPDPKTSYKERPCVVLAGGREPAHWEMYQHQAFLHNCGQYACNRQGGCWKARTVPLKDSNPGKDKSLCEQPVKIGNQKYPRCMSDVSPAAVIEAMNRYLDTWENPYA